MFKGNDSKINFCPSDRSIGSSVSLNNNLLTSLGPALRYNPMKYFSMVNNRISHLGPEDLQGELIVRHLDLQRNVITQVESLTFANVAEQLWTLDLSRNRIESLQGCLQNLTNLDVLNLSHNKIQVFTPNEFYKMNMLTELHLEGNRIATLDSEIHALTGLRILSISNNQIRTISTNQLPPKLTHLFLAGNPFHCDSQMLPFLQFLNSTEKLKTDEDLCTPSQNGTALVSVPAPALPPADVPVPTIASYLWTAVPQDSPICHLFSPQGRITFITAKYNVLPFFVQNSTVLQIFLPRANKEMPFVIVAEVEGLNLSNNKLRSLEDARLPSRTRFLFLDHNLIHKLPVVLLESLKFLTRVTLSNNPWVCDCNALDFKKWVASKSILVLDMNDPRCGPDMPDSPGLAIWLHSDQDLCPHNTVLYISMGFGVLRGKIAWTRYETNVKVWLYSHGVTWVKEKDIDRDKEFDAFISFSHKDQDAVIQELIEVIEEKDPDIRLCLHYKHFLPGEFIQKEHHEGRGVLQENSPRALSEIISKFRFIKSILIARQFFAVNITDLKIQRSTLHYMLNHAKSGQKEVEKCDVQIHAVIFCYLSQQ
ncbi:protein toll [Caerostris extrusa]|uniref:Protein toll n=1 Tax=Caerostris extrusa TaxID=172846 RepID=A0AAV4Y5Z5_CAEEX|nr:protein toll [Caerostris extrusa]